MDKIKKTMRATVMVFNGDRLIGSGTIVDAGTGAVIITNEHIAKAGEGDLFVVTAGGKNFKTKTVFTDQNKDLAILESDENLTAAVKAKKVNALKLASKQTQEKLNFGDKLSAIGHPMGFPFEVALSEYAGSIEPIAELFNKTNPKSDIPYQILNRPDPRFTKLQTYDVKLTREPVEAKKGNILRGMSGGPLID